MPRVCLELNTLTNIMRRSLQNGNMTIYMVCFMTVLQVLSLFLMHGSGHMTVFPFCENSGMEEK